MDFHKIMCPGAPGAVKMMPRWVQGTSRGGLGVREVPPGAPGLDFWAPPGPFWVSFWGNFAYILLYFCGHIFA